MQSPCDLRLILPFTFCSERRGSKCLPVSRKSRINIKMDFYLDCSGEPVFGRVGYRQFCTNSRFAHHSYRDAWKLAPSPLPAL